MLKHYIAAMLVSVAALGSVSHAQAQDRLAGMSAPRAAAVHECSVRAGRYPETTWSSLEFQLYRACMAEHGQVE